MTAEKLHDALSLLPTDLVAQTDKLRARPIRTRSHWKAIAAMAACFAVVVFAAGFIGIVTQNMGSSKSAATVEMAVESPGDTAAAAEAQTEAAMDMAPKEELPIPETAAGNADRGSAASSTVHAPAQTEQMVDDRVTGFCGNTTATIYLDGEAHSISGTDAVALTSILINLDYDPALVCRCAAEFTADTETESGFEINLTQYFVRCARGQTALTEEQADTIRGIIGRLEVK